MARQLIPSAAPWGGYSRAVRVGNRVEVAGTVATGDDGAIVAPGDMYQQCRHILTIIEGALAEAGAAMSDVVRTRTFVTDISQVDEFLRAHTEVFADILPAATLVEVSGLLGEGAVAEIEAIAVIEAVAANEELSTSD